MHKDNDEIVQEMIEAGALELEGIDSESGEFLYKITDKMKDINKALYDEHLNMIYSDTMYFWERGFLDISDFSSVNPMISLTSKAFDPKAISELSLEKAELFIRIKDALKENKK
jgi:hypothetical protein